MSEQRPIYVAGPPPLPPVPTRGPVERWLAEARECFDQLRHGSHLIEETGSAQWQRPTDARAALPDRQPVGAVSDPTGDTVADTRRQALRAAVTGLIDDPRREHLWTLAVAKGDAMCWHAGIDLTRRTDRHGHRWFVHRDQMAAHLGHVAAHVDRLAASDPTGLEGLAHDLRRANSHTEQRLRRVSLAMAAWTGLDRDPTGHLHLEHR